MIRLFIFLALTVALLVRPALADERTITLNVENMTCVVCQYRVKKALERVPGVTKAAVSVEEKTAVVTYDDTKTDVEALVGATTKAGFPSALKR